MTVSMGVSSRIPWWFPRDLSIVLSKIIPNIMFKCSIVIFSMMKGSLDLLSVGTIYEAGAGGPLSPHSSLFPFTSMEVP